MAVRITEKQVQYAEFSAGQENSYGDWIENVAYVVRVDNKLYFTTEEYVAACADPALVDFELVLTPAILALAVKGVSEGKEVKRDGNMFMQLEDTFLKFKASCGATFRVPFLDLEIILQEFGD